MSSVDVLAHAVGFFPAAGQHSSPYPHAIPHPPQFLMSFRSLHAPLQQSWLVAHTVPQPPQFWMSFVFSTQPYDPSSADLQQTPFAAHGEHPPHDDARLASVHTPPQQTESGG
jgi:hypothetical protein